MIGSFRKQPLLAGVPAAGTLGALLLLAAAMLPATTAQAAQVSLQMHRDVRHYAVSGRNELAMLRSMRRNGPRVDGKPALASTRMQTRYTARLRQRNNRCRVQRLDIDTRFTMTLPRLRNASAVSARTRKRWPAFLQRLKQHEERHISIWRSCLRQVRRTLPTLSAPSCQQLKRKLRSTYRRIMDDCGKRHDAFDRRERHAAANLPFIRAAFRAAHGRMADARKARKQRQPRKTTTRHHNWR